MGPEYGDPDSVISSLPQSPGVSPPQRPSFVPKIAVERVHNVVTTQKSSTQGVSQVQAYKLSGRLHSKHPQASVPQAQQPLTVLSQFDPLSVCPLAIFTSMFNIIRTVGLACFML